MKYLFLAVFIVSCGSDSDGGSSGGSTAPFAGYWSNTSQYDIGGSSATIIVKLAFDGDRFVRAQAAASEFSGLQITYHSGTFTFTDSEITFNTERSSCPKSEALFLTVPYEYLQDSFSLNGEAYETATEASGEPSGFTGCPVGTDWIDGPIQDLD